MNNTVHIKTSSRRMLAVALTATMSLAAAWSHAAPIAKEQRMSESQNANETLSELQQSIVPIAAFAAAGDIAKLNLSIEQGLDAGLTISEVQEVLVQVYAYAGFPRSLNALGELMKVLEARKKRDIEDAPGTLPTKAAPKGDDLLKAGTANQTKLVGAPVKGALFEFAPAIDEYLKTHLFGDIFERDNLDWKAREVATVSMLSVLPGAEAQVQSHMQISKNIGLTTGQLGQLAGILKNQVNADAGKRAQNALDGLQK